VPLTNQFKPILMLVVAALTIACMVCGCSPPEEPTPKSSLTKKTRTVVPDERRQINQPQEVALDRVDAPGAKKPLAEQSQDTDTAKPVTEKITGYKTPAEYFSIASRNYADGIVAISLPLDYGKNPTKKYPLIIVFGGAGECARSPRQSALAWMHYYKTDEAVAALQTNRLVPENFRGLAKPAVVMDYNRRLRRQPYEGVILACPSSPLVTAQAGPELPEIEEYIMDELLPALKRRYRVSEDKIGVDGVSMGGARSMYYGMKYPEVFASIGSVQGAFGPYMDLYRYLAKTNRQLLQKRSIQLVTSDHDVMLHSVEAFHKLLQENQIGHSFLVLTGPHDYIFNQGPGAISLLVFHNQALRRGK
jgi:pimeloyl-ACP methyl ester carboxylesterase